MKIEHSKEWWLARAMREPDVTIGAGLAAYNKMEVETDAYSEVGGDVRIAFGRFVNLMRRKQGLTIEDLADKANIDISELLVIEEDSHHRPGPRTVFQLAQLFDVPQLQLMQLAGLAVANDSGFHEEAVRFAARSEAVEKLSPEESAALNAFVSILSEQPKTIE